MGYETRHPHVKDDYYGACWLYSMAPPMRIDMAEHRLHGRFIDPSLVDYHLGHHIMETPRPSGQPGTPEIYELYTKRGMHPRKPGARRLRWHKVLYHMFIQGATGCTLEDPLASKKGAE